MKRILILTALAVALAMHGQTKVEVKKAGMLAEVLTQEQKDTCSHLVVSGKLNSADIRVLRQMAGYAEEEGQGVGRLRVLDLREARMVTDKTPFLVLDAAAEGLAGTAVPGKVKDRHDVLGVSLQSQHEHNYDYRMNASGSSNWNKPKYNSSFSNVMIQDGSVVSYYHPVYVLGVDSLHRVSTAGQVYRRSDTAHLPGDNVNMNSEGNFNFAKGLTDEQWTDMGRKQLRNSPGHNLSRQDDGRYVMAVHTTKGRFIHDTFYKCPTLEAVYLPFDLYVDYTVGDSNSKTKYFTSISPKTIKRQERELRRLQRKIEEDFRHITYPDER